MIDRNFIYKIFPRHIKILNEINSIPDFFKFVQNNPAKTTITKSRFKIYDKLIEDIDNPIDYLEFGVYQGETIKYWADKIKNSESRFFGFDSFEGLPETYNSTHQKGSFSTCGKIPNTDDDRIKFIKGWFNDTFPEFLKSFDSKYQKIIHMDADLYSSTLFVLTQIHPFLKNGDIIIFDEFGSMHHEFRAWIDFTNSYNQKYDTLISFKTHYPHAKIVFEINKS